MDELKELKEGVNNGFQEVNIQFKDVDNQFKKVDEQFKNVNKQFKKVDEQFKNVNKQFQKVDEHFEELENKLDQNVNELRADMKKLLDHQFVFEQEFGRKLDAIYDAVTLELDKNLEKSEKIRKLESRTDRNELNIFNHEKRISIIERNQ